MRSAVALLSNRRLRGVTRARIAPRGKARRLSSPESRGARRASDLARGVTRVASVVAARKPLGRVRPLRTIPRGVVPYVKH